MSLTEHISQCAPVERASKEAIGLQAEFFADSGSIRTFLDSIPTTLLVLNEQRQIVFSNRALLELLGIEEGESLHGLRAGEALNCVHAFETDLGCGATLSCRTCGALKAILAAQSGQKDLQEFRIMRRNAGILENLDLRIRTTPLETQRGRFTIFTATDISHEKRRRALERIFFHDVLNTAGVLRGFAQLLKDADQEMLEEFTGTIVEASNRIIAEISTQKDLLSAEENDLRIKPTFLNSLDFLGKMSALHSRHEVAQGCHILIDPRSAAIRFETDATLLGRVMGNMVKNGLEASRPGDTVTLGCEVREEEIRFWVHNGAPMPEDVQLQVFQRSFSTKGSNRGLGTYSMKLLSERYLKGKICFKTSPEEGTTFEARFPIRLSQTPLCRGE